MDIKESNILITHCDENASTPLTGYLPIRFKLADFGISVNLSNEQRKVSFNHSNNNFC